MLNLTRDVLISASREAVQQYLHDLRNIAEYERKVELVQEVSYPDSQNGFVSVTGRIMGLPWRGAFKMEFTRDGGYRTEMVRGPLSRLSGGFHLRPVSGGTIVTYQEQVQLPWLLRPLGCILKRWIGRHVETRLDAVKEGAERLNRRLQLEKLDAER
ncbi:MAG: hypothetical protein HY921_06995 [Elusimicrobia bacterium]|nr:hypothetical protein [Elusimicrobiota bacterium]